MMKELADKDLKAIIARRDRRFDGRFYFGVKTTRIYCRPICPARPKPENILIFRSHSEAENMGFRPCLRCRPDLAPGSKLLDGTANTVSRALRIIQASADDNLNVTSLADTLGVTDRHLRRLFAEHLGASPIDIVITQRLHFAKQLIQETAMPITDIAFAAGFQSIRRFNEAFKDRYHQSPSTFRQAKHTLSSHTIDLKIPLRLPYDWSSVMAYLQRHDTYGLETADSQRYQRFVTRGNSFGTVVVTGHAKHDFLHTRFINIPLNEIRPLLSRLKTLFDTDHNPVHLPTSKSILPNGIRVPGCFDPFETAVSIILSQVVSTAQAKAKQKALVQTFGRPIGVHEGQDVFAFPLPSQLAEAEVEKIGVTRSKGDAIRGLSQALVQDKLRFQAHGELGSALQTLEAIKGIGAWTTAMIAMRCFGDPDAFPASDLIVQRALAQKIVDPTEWASSRAYLTHCLWRDFSSTLTKRGKV